MTPGPMNFRGIIMGPVSFRGPSSGPIEMTLRNQYMEDRRPFLFWRSHQNPDKTVAYENSDKYVAFSRLFWSSQNRRCVIFELAPGPRLALGAPGSDTIAVLR